MTQIIIIPGIGGSKIYCNCKNEEILLYPKKMSKLFCNLNKEFFNKECKTITKPFKSWYGISIYHNFIKKFNATLYHYDWRQPCIKLARDLIKFLNSITGDLILIGHSNGGLLIRIMYEYYNYHNSSIKFSFICGTPLYGHLNMTNYLYEHQLANNLMDADSKIGKYKPLMMTKSDFKRILSTYRETLEFLCPTPIILQSNMIIPKALHLKLSRRDFSKYIFIFNVHKRKRHIIENVYTIMHRKIMTDSLVVPMMDFVNNTTVFYDHDNFPHFAMLNSIDLQNFIRKNIQG